VQDEVREEGAQKEHGHPVAVERGALGGGGDVVECDGGAEVADAVEEGARASAEEGEEFGGAGAADVGGSAREGKIYVVEFDVGGGLGETFDEGLHHEALAVNGRRELG